MQKTYGIGLILFSSLLFASYGVWAKLIGDGMDIFFQGWSRAVIIVIVLAPILYYKKLIVPIKREHWKWFAIFLTFTAGTQAPLFYAFTHMDIGSATLLFFVSMLLTMYTIGYLFLGERMTKVKTTSFFLACIGMYFIFQFSLATFTLLAALMAILNGIASGGEISSSKKFSSSYSTLYITWLSWVIILITNAPISFILGERILMPSFEIVWLWQLCYTVASMLAFWLIIEGLKYVEAGVGGLLGLLEIVFSVMLGVILFSEEITTQVLIGSSFILTAAALPHIMKMKNKISNRRLNT